MKNHWVFKTIFEFFGSWVYKKVHKKLPALEILEIWDQKQIFEADSGAGN